MENITLKACCALCEYLWDENNCPLFKTLEVARNIGDYTYNNDLQFRMMCDEFEINSKYSKFKVEMRLIKTPKTKDCDDTGE